jgi:hypothetical protein
MEVFDVAQSRRKAAKNKSPRIFTLEHANRTLPLVQRVVADMVRQYKKVDALEERCHIRRPSVSSEVQANLCRQYETELEKLREFTAELTAIGCEIKDWRMGLIDFAAVREGRVVELCWKLGEPRIEFWHEVGAGFQNRQPIDEAFAAPATA